MLVVICPNCRHRFPAPGCCENLHRRSESNFNQPPTCYYGGVLVPRGHSGGGCFINNSTNQSMALNSNHPSINGDLDRQRSTENYPRRVRNNPENRGSFVGDNESGKSGGSFSITTPSIQSGGRLIQSNDWITDSGALLQGGEIEIRPKLSGGGCLIQKKPSTNHVDTILIQESRNFEKKMNQQQKILVLPPSGCQELPGIRKTDKIPGANSNFSKKQLQLWEKISGKEESRGKSCYCNGNVLNLQNCKFDGNSWREQAADDDVKSNAIHEWEHHDFGIFQSGGLVMEKDATWWNAENSENSIHCNGNPRFSIFQNKENPSEEFFVPESTDNSDDKFSIFHNKENCSGNSDFSIFENSVNDNSKSDFYICDGTENCDIKSEFSTSQSTNNCNVKFVPQNRENSYIKSEFPIFENRINRDVKFSNSSNLENQKNFNITSNTYSNSDNKENCDVNTVNFPIIENAGNLRKIKFDDISISKNCDANTVDFLNLEQKENHSEKSTELSNPPSSLEIQVNATVKLPASFGHCTLNITATTSSNLIAKPPRSLNNFNGGGIVENDTDQQQRQQQITETRTEDNRTPTTPISWLMPCPWNFDSVIMEKDVQRMIELKRLLQTCGWYHEGLSWQQSENLLKNSSVGRWLMRDSSDSRFLFAVSVQTARGPTSVRVHHFFGRFRLDAEPRLAFAMPLFDCPIRMLEYYVEYSRSVEESRKEVWVDYSGQVYSEIYLTRPLVKEVRSLSHLSRIVVNRCKLQTQHLPTIIRNYLEEYPYSL